MTELRLKPDGSRGVFTTRHFCAGELVAKYGVLSMQEEAPDVDMFITYKGAYAIGDPDGKEHAQFINDSVSCGVELEDGYTIHDIPLKNILLIKEYLGKSITNQNVCREGLDFYACKSIDAGTELYISYGTTYWLKNDLIDACIQALTECQYNDELCAAQDIIESCVRAVKIYTVEKRIILDFTDMLMTGEYSEFYRGEY